MAEADVRELNERFAVGNQQLEADVVSELLSIMRMHSLTPQDLFFKWESYCIKMDMGGNALSVDSLRALKQDIQDALERHNRSHHAHIKTEKRVGATPRPAMKNGGDFSNMLDGLLPNTPATGKLNKTSTKKRPFETPSVTRIKDEVPSSSPEYRPPGRADPDSVGALPARSFKDRKDAKQVIEVLNDHLPDADPPIAPYGESRIRLTAASDQKRLGYKTLAMKSSEASGVLDDRIEDFLVLFKEHHGLEDTAFGSAASQSTTEIVAVGRIASDSPEGKMNEASLVLETSRKTGAGRRIHLNLDRLQGKYQFFPGQIVAFKGINTSGHEFVVNEILAMPLMPSAASSPVAIEGHRQKLRGGPNAMESDDEPAPLRVIFGSGPYSADDNLNFEPLQALCSEAADTYADALILTGPFIDVDHPLVATGDFDLPEEALVEPDTATMSTVFKYMISPALNRLAASNPHITILLIPSVRDIIDKHVSWPQDVVPRKDLGLPKTARFVGNPMTLSLNEMVLGISSQDILTELRLQELVGSKVDDKSLMSRLPKYLIEQRHYFPIFPPADRRSLPKTGTEDGVATGAMLDTSYLQLGDIINVKPDIMILPSALPPFARVIESVLVINPGYLSKRRAAGTFARMTLHPPKATEEELSRGGEGITHKVFERARVDITKI